MVPAKLTEPLPSAMRGDARAAGEPAGLGAGTRPGGQSALVLGVGGRHHPGMKDVDRASPAEPFDGRDSVAQIPAASLKCQAGAGATVSSIGPARTGMDAFGPWDGRG